MVSTIAELFTRGWLEVERWPGDAGRLDLPSDPEVLKAVRAYLKLDDEQVIVAKLARLAMLNPQDDTERAQLLLVLRAIDQAFEPIHPRSLMAKPSVGASAIPSWLSRAEEQRNEHGTYWTIDGYSLIPRGPLARPPREDGCDGGRNVAERFNALAVVLGRYVRPTPAVNLSYRVIDTDPEKGVRLGHRVGRERIAHVPLGQAPSDVTLSLLKDGSVTKLVSTVDDSVDIATRFHLAGQGLGQVDVLMAPEFMVDSDVADSIASRLSSSRDVDARIIAAGTGLSSDARAGQHWNEARLLNTVGHCLWRQRKIWPAIMRRDLAEKLGADVDENQSFEEATAADDCIVVADIAAFGRVVVLICQDLKLPTAAAFIAELQPDWIFVPIFDRGVCAQRWTHIEAAGLAGKSEARFLVGSSMSLARKLDPATTATCLMALGPRDPSSKDDKPRAYFLSPVMHTESGVEYAELTWREGDWKQTSVVVKNGENAGDSSLVC